jgi:hypothetical protein
VRLETVGLEGFYAEAAELARLSVAEREARLRALAPAG